jgi:hypothetical protein
VDAIAPPSPFPGDVVEDLPLRVTKAIADTLHFG